jgi:hypothetical protein
MATIQSDKIDSAIEFLKRLKQEEEAFIQFQKKDGSERIMRCTLDFSKIPVKDRPKNFKIENILSLIKKNILHVYDLENFGWRSVPVDKTKWIQVKSGKKYMVHPEFSKEMSKIKE